MAINLRAVLSLDDRLSRKLASATSVINKMDGQTKSVDRSLSRVGATGRNSFNSINNSAGKATLGIGKIIGAIGGIVAGFGAAKLAGDALNATIGEAARYQQSEVLINAMFDDKKLSKQYNAMVQKLAQDSPIMDTSTMMGSSKAFIGITKSMPALKQAWQVAEKLSIMDPEQGLQGAVYAMKELASGDGVSMAERFEMPKSVVNDIKKLSFDDQLKAMDKYLAKTGITSKTVDQMGTTTVAKWNQVKEKLTATFRTMGQGGNSQIGKALDGILKGIDSGAFDKLAKQVDSTLGNALKNVSNYVKTIDFTELATKASNTFKTLSDSIKWVSDNFKGIKEAAIGVTTALAAFKVGMAIAPVIMGVAKAIRLFRSATTAAAGAQAVFNLALNANPIGIVVTAIAGLIAIIVVLYRNWGTVTKRTKAFWNAIGGGAGAIRIVMGPLGILIGAAIDLAKNWDSTKSVWENVWGAMKRSAASTVNSVIGGINEMIKIINKIPGVNIPVVAKVNWGNDHVATTQYKPARTIGGAQPIGYDAGLDRVPYDGFIARLHEGERIQTREEAKATRNGDAGGIHVSFAGANFNVRQESDAEAIAKALANEIFSRRKVVG